MDKREDRRDRTWRKAFSRRKQHFLTVHTAESPGCDCRGSVWMFDRRTLGCGCRRQRKGRPRIGGGYCRMGIRDHILEARRRWRERAQRVLRRGEWEEENERAHGSTR